MGKKKEKKKEIKAVLGKSVSLTAVETRRLSEEPIRAIRPIVQMHDSWQQKALSSRKRL